MRSGLVSPIPCQAPLSVASQYVARAFRDPERRVAVAIEHSAVERKLMSHLMHHGGDVRFSAELRGPAIDRLDKESAIQVAGDPPRHDILGAALASSKSRLWA